MNKNSPFSFSDLVSLGFSSLFIAITSFAYRPANPLIGFLLGLIAMLFGIISLREPGQENFERRTAWMGIIVSAISMMEILFLSNNAVLFS